MKKRILRRFTDSGRKMNLNNGIFCAEQVQFVVCTAVHNIDGRRTLVLYVYPKDEVLSGNLTPRWTVFQTRDEYLSLYMDEKGTRWQTCMFDDLNKEYHLSNKCAFYASSDEQRVVRFCKMPKSSPRMPRFSPDFWEKAWLPRSIRQKLWRIFSKRFPPAYWIFTGTLL